MLFHLSLIIELFSLIYTQKIISLFLNYEHSIQSVDLFIKPKPLPVSRPINTAINITWFPYFDFYNFSFPSEVERTEVLLTTLEPAFVIQNDILYKKTNLVSNFTFMIIDTKSFYHKDSGIGLTFKFENKSYSLIHQLYKEQKINKMQFAFESNNNNNGTLHIGGIPNNNHLKSTFKGYCNVNNNYSTWGCVLKSLGYEGTTFDVGQYSIFNSAIYYPFSSKKFYDFMKNIVLKELVEDEICIENTSNLQKAFFKCKINQGQQLKFGNISFHFEKTIIEYPIINLFERKNDYLLSIFYMGNETDIDESIFGFPFIQTLNYTLFDYDNEQIWFYSDLFQITQLDNYNQFHSITYIFIILIIIMIFNTIYLCIQKIRK